MGHGRTLINIDSKEKQLIIYEKILRSGLSVRQTEKIVKDLNQKKKKKEFSKNDGLLEKKIMILQKKYNLIIDLKLKNEKGHLSFKFDSISQLNKLIKKLDE
jgi:ParB family chromosome partitioning protein